MKLPRDLSGAQVASNLKKICFKEVRQRGSHLILRRASGEQVTIPLHESLKTGIVKEPSRPLGGIQIHPKISHKLHEKG